MSNKRQDWPHKILVHLFENYSGFDVHLNPFLQKDLNIGLNDGNLARKVVRTLKELKNRGLITWTHSDHKNETIELNDDDNDNTSVTLAVYWFHARLTFDGLVYISTYSRQTKQDLLNIFSIVSSVVATIFIIVTTVQSCNDNTDKELKELNNTVKQSIQRLDSIGQGQKRINESIQELNKQIQTLRPQKELKDTKTKKSSLKD
jgi:hypothetical protein